MKQPATALRPPQAKIINYKINGFNILCAGDAPAMCGACPAIICSVKHLSEQIVRPPTIRRIRNGVDQLASMLPSVPHPSHADAHRLFRAAQPRFSIARAHMKRCVSVDARSRIDDDNADRNEVSS
jgi:hypothetical protein